MDFDVCIQDGHHLRSSSPPPRSPGVSKALLLIVLHPFDTETWVLPLKRLHINVQIILQVLWIGEKKKKIFFLLDSLRVHTMQWSPVSTLITQSAKQIQHMLFCSFYSKWAWFKGRDKELIALCWRAPLIIYLLCKLGLTVPLTNTFQYTEIQCNTTTTV